jgi:outer membrane protein OmpA-like peptidoglycan-associated protein
MSSDSRRTFLKSCAAVVLGTAAGKLLAATEPAVCSNQELLSALQVLHRACTPLRCNFTKLRELNDARYRDALLAAFANRDLNTVHIFFPSDKSEISDCFDWASGKQSQLNTFKYLNNASQSTVYLIGRASTTGSIDHNRLLSAARMQSVHDYLRYKLRIPCPNFRGAWMGKEILQFSLSDAHYLQLPAQEFRSDPLVLNQAVHAFAIPCGDIGL